MLSELLNHYEITNGIIVVQTNPMLHTLNQAAAMLKTSDQSDPDLQRYLRHTDTHKDRQTEIPCFYREM